MVRRAVAVRSAPCSALALNQAPVLMLSSRDRGCRRKERLGVASAHESLHGLHLPALELAPERVLEERAEEVRARPERGQLHDLRPPVRPGFSSMVRSEGRVARTNLAPCQVARLSAYTPARAFRRSTRRTVDSGSVKRTDLRSCEANARYGGRRCSLPACANYQHWRSDERAPAHAMGADDSRMTPPQPRAPC